MRPEPEQPAPERGRRGPWEGDAVGADLQRDDGDGQPEEQRQHAGEHQAVAVQAEQLADGVGVEDLARRDVDPLEREQPADHQAAPTTTSETAMYSRPMRLWSTVVTQPASPAGTGAGRRSGAAMRGRRFGALLHLRRVVGDGHGSSTRAARVTLTVMVTIRKRRFACRRRTLPMCMDAVRKSSRRPATTRSAPGCRRRSRRTAA